MKIETIKIEKLRPYEKNSRQHPPKQISLIAENIKRFGFTTPLLISKDNEIIAGHGRLEAAQKIGMKELPCVRMEKLNDKEIKALRIADNRLAEMAEWNMDLAIEELRGLGDDLVDLTGFDRDLLIEGNERDDVLPENPPARAKRGDIWQLGRHRVMCGDSEIRKGYIMKLLDGRGIDLILTDPPYGMDLNTDWSKAKSDLNFYKEKGCKGQGGKYNKVIGDDKDFDPREWFEYFKNVKEQFWWGGRLL